MLLSYELVKVYDVGAENNDRKLSILTVHWKKYVFFDGKSLNQKSLSIKRYI